MSLKSNILTYCPFETPLPFVEVVAAHGLPGDRYEVVLFANLEEILRQGLIHRSRSRDNLAQDDL